MVQSWPAGKRPPLQENVCLRAKNRPRPNRGAERSGLGAAFGRDNPKRGSLFGTCAVLSTLYLPRYLPYILQYLTHLAYLSTTGTGC